MRVLRGRRELEQVNDIDEADLEIGEVLPQHGDCGERFIGRDVAGTRHHDIRLDPSSLLASDQMPRPLVQCWMASSIVKYCRCFCLSATITLT